MLSSSPAVPLHSIDFHDGDRRRLSLRTHGGQEYLTAHDGLPSPEHLTPISGTPHAGHTPEASDAGSAPLSRRGSDLATIASESEGNNRFGSMASLNRAPSRRTNDAAAAAGEVSFFSLGLQIACCRVVISVFHLSYDKVINTHTQP